jgi:hypothetical protein
MNYEELLQFKGTFYNDNENNTGVEWYIEEKEKELIIRIPGTNATLDWVTNFIFFPIQYYNSNAKVHSGWYKEYIQSCINVKITEIIKKKNYKKIIIMAHSKGCATALFLTQYLAQVFNVQIETFLLASPKVGNYRFKKLVENNAIVHNIQVKGDAVCKLPPNIILLFFWPYLLISNLIINKQFVFCFFWHIEEKRKIGKYNLITFKGHGFSNYKRILSQ